MTISNIQHRLLLTVIIATVVSTVSFAQSSDQKARAYFIQAESAYNSQQLDKAVEYLSECTDLLGKTNARIEALRVKIYFDQKDYNKAKEALTSFYEFDATDALEREMSVYIIRIDEKLEEERLRIERERKAEIEKQRQEARRIQEETLILSKTNQYLEGDWIFYQVNCCFTRKQKNMRVTFIPLNDNSGYIYYEDRSFNRLRYSDEYIKLINRYGSEDHYEAFKYAQKGISASVGAVSFYKEVTGSSLRFSNISRFYLNKYNGLMIDPDSENLIISYQNRTNPVGVKDAPEYLLNNKNISGFIYLGKYELVYREDEILLKEVEELLDLNIHMGWIHDLERTNKVVKETIAGERGKFRIYNVMPKGKIFAWRKFNGWAANYGVKVNFSELERVINNRITTETRILEGYVTYKQELENSSTAVSSSLRHLIDIINVDKDIFEVDMIFQIPDEKYEENERFEQVGLNLDSFVNYHANKLFKENKHTEAFELLRVNANYGAAQSQYLLALLYSMGEGTELDYREAFNWYRQASIQGHTEAQCKLGKAYYEGLGTEVDREEAKRWIDKANRNSAGICSVN